MSGICGLFNLDGEPVAEPDLAAMTAMLERRGPERTGRWRDNSVGLGHTLLATTPELLFELQPFGHAATDCMITADVRLDNREELHDALRVPRPLYSVGDADLIVLAYLRWGERCVSKLLGDFAFALWDPRKRLMLCARDHFGLRPFYYHNAPGRRFVFASDARAILALPKVSYQINSSRIADFLVPQLEWIDYTSTFFEDVYRLPPGHMAIVSLQGLEISEYWKPEPGPDTGLVSDDEYREGFLEVFATAVESRLRAPPGTVGSMLSGGMDSGSIVAIAREILRSRDNAPLHTFSSVRSHEPGCAESAAIRAAIAMPSISPTLVCLEDLGAKFESLIANSEEPFDGEAMILKAIYLAAHEQGRRVLLDGAGGDVVLSEGSYIIRLLRQGQLGLAVREIACENRLWHGSILGPNMFLYTATAFAPEALKRLMRGSRRRRRARRWIEHSLISQEFAHGVAIDEHFDRMWCTFPSGSQPDYAVERCSVIRPSVTAGRERYSRLATVANCEARDPFLDKRVVDYCSKLPGRLLLKNGWPKVVLRELMAGRIPEEVRWLRGKPHLGWLFNTAVTGEASRRGALSLSAMRETLAPYVDEARLERAWQEFQGGGPADRIHSAHVLSVWLRENGTRPVVPQRRIS